MAVFAFPDPVNEKAARAVAAQVLLACIVTLVLSIVAGPAWLWMLAGLAAGFLARVLTGPTLSPFGQLATRVLAPRLGRAKLVPGPPKRFAQGIGLLVTAAATVLFGAGHPLPAQLLLVVMIVASGLESIFAFCLGCKAFALLMKLGLIPEAVCAECADISLHARGAA